MYCKYCIYLFIRFLSGVVILRTTRGIKTTNITAHFMYFSLHCALITLLCTAHFDMHISLYYAHITVLCKDHCTVHCSIYIALNTLLCTDHFPLHWTLYYALITFLYTDHFIIHISLHYALITALCTDDLIADNIMAVHTNKLPFLMLQPPKLIW